MKFCERNYLKCFRFWFTGRSQNKLRSRMNTTFVKLPQSSGKTSFLLTQLKEDGKEGFELTLTDGEKFWEGQLTEEDLDALSSNLKMDFNTFVSHTVAAFTRHNMADSNYAYQIKQQAEGVIDLLWKQELGDIKILMGSVTLHKEKGAAKALTRLFTNCIDMASELQQKICTLEADNQRLAQERQNALKRLDKCVSAKEELEQDLYAKFAAVLNSKKEKIRSLQEGRGDGESIEDAAVPSTSSEAVNGRKGMGRTTVSKVSLADNEGEKTSSGDEDKDRDTDDETPPKKRRAPMSKASKVDADSSLNLGDDNEDDDDKGKSVVKRPARQRGGNKRHTPAKPVLPKVSSSRSSEGGRKTPQRGSLRKSGSGNSDRSVENVDTDDLMNDF
ncbi:hypothetical protein V1264_002680 [Littorina saxatilis]|uniref:Uncharacterized protein n=2 Tax=Littorina saxatilis TaxID=31220 RepID=A0AAN9B5V3_9CAEN